MDGEGSFGGAAAPPHRPATQPHRAAHGPPCPLLLRLCAQTRNSASGGAQDRLACGMVAGLTGQFVAYPLDVCRRCASPPVNPPVPELRPGVCRRMQVGGGSIVSVLGHCYKTEGLAGLFKGFSMNCIKGPISTGISFTLFDLLKEAML